MFIEEKTPRIDLIKKMRNSLWNKDTEMLARIPVDLFTSQLPACRLEETEQTSSECRVVQGAEHPHWECLQVQQRVLPGVALVVFIGSLPRRTMWPTHLLVLRPLTGGMLETLLVSTDGPTSQSWLQPHLAPEVSP